MGPRFGWLGALLALVVVVVVLGASNPVRRAGTSAVSLGPRSGEPVQAYVTRAATGAPTTGGPYWALVSLRSEVSPAAAAGLVGDARLARVVLRVPIDRVQTTQLPVDVVDQGDLATELAVSEVAAGSGRQRHADAGTGRAAAVAAVSASRLRAGCACVLALLVRGSAAQLRAITAHAEVRAVETAPEDAAPQHVAVNALLPEQTTLVQPAPDDGAVPAR